MGAAGRATNLLPFRRVEFISKGLASRHLLREPLPSFSAAGVQKKNGGAGGARPGNPRMTR
jgi:hypothetical protein